MHAHISLYIYVCVQVCVCTCVVMCVCFCVSQIKNLSIKGHANFYILSL